MNPVLLFLKDMASETIATAIIAGLAYLVVKYRSRLGKFGKRMSISPNQAKIASEVDGDIYLTTGAGTKNLTHSSVREAGALWAHNSDWLAFSRGDDARWQVWICNTTTGKLVCFTDGLKSSRPIKWDIDDSLVIDLGGSAWVIKNDEIRRRLM